MTFEHWSIGRRMTIFFPQAIFLIILRAVPISKGIMATFTLDFFTGCGPRFRTEFSGRITSPGYPSNYPNNMDCEYILTYPEQGMNVRLVSNSFEMESSSGCGNDYLAIYDGRDYRDRLIGRYCNSFPAGGVITTGTSMMVRFRSNWRVSKKGFDFSFYRGR